MLRTFVKIGVFAVGACVVFAGLGSADAEMYQVTKKGTPSYTNAPVKITPSTKVIDNTAKSGSASKSGGSANKKSAASSWKENRSTAAQTTGKESGDQNTGQNTEENQGESTKRSSGGDLGPPR